MSTQNKFVKVLAILTMLGVMTATPSITSPTAESAEPDLESVLFDNDKLDYPENGFFEVPADDHATFPPGVYTITLLAEYCGGCDDELELSWYEVGTNNFNLLFAGPEGNFGITDPPISRTIFADVTFGLSIKSNEGRFFSERGRNPDRWDNSPIHVPHYLVYQNRFDLSFYLAGFEEEFGGGDNDFQDKVIEIKPSFICSDGSSTDSDGDGLLDCWEAAGFIDFDLDGILDVDLFGLADPNHKDLFLEFDWAAGRAPTRAEIQALKQAFALTPVDAGGVSNPDGLPGINLWIDTGNLSDSLGLVGDNLGGGNQISGPANCLGQAFYDVKFDPANFDPMRNYVFRYGISGDPANNTRDDGVSCKGGRAEIGGNDFIEFNNDAGTIMHELGHTLNLRHGGDVHTNRKPNYISVMNYDYQFGIPQAGGTEIFDYSPPRFPGGRGQAPLLSIEENNLNEFNILDPTDSTNMLIFTDSDGDKVQASLDQRIDWNQDGDTDDSGITLDVNDSGSINSDPHGGYDDWSNIVLDLRSFRDSADGAINPVMEPEPDIEDRERLREALYSTDLEILKSSSPDPVVAGEVLTYSFRVENNGPNPTPGFRVVDTLPTAATFLSTGPGCSYDQPSHTVTCLHDYMPTNTNYSATISVSPKGPGILINTARVESLLGSDPEPFNNFVIETTEVHTPIDVWPYLEHNIVVPTRRHPVPVAILSTFAFDAPALVDKASLTFGRTGDEPSLNHCSPFDVDINGDGLLDLLCTFQSIRTGFLPGDTLGILKVRTFYGMQFEGRDNVSILPSMNVGLFRAIMTGGSEVPPVNTTANGVGRFSFRLSDSTLDFALNVRNLANVTSAHIHCGTPGTNGPVGLTLFQGAPVTLPAYAGPVTAPDIGNSCGWTDMFSVAAAMLSGDSYVNIHTSSHPAGEIRGQILTR